MKHLCLLALIPLIIPNLAGACSCWAGMAYSLPADGSSNVPLNPLIHMGFGFEVPETFTLVSATGEVIPTEPFVEHFPESPNSVVALLLPSGLPLRAESAYTLSGDGNFLLRFTTGGMIDIDPPALREISEFSGGYDDGCSPCDEDKPDDGCVSCSSCGSSTWMEPTYDGVSDDLTPEDQLLYRVFIEKGEAIPNTGSFSVVVPRSWSIGSGFCSTTYPGLEPGDTVTIRASSIDSAGLQSPLSDPISAIVADDPDTDPTPSTCASGPKSPTSFAGLVGLVFVALFGRRKA